MNKTLQEIVLLIKPEYTVVLIDEDIDVWDSEIVVYEGHGGDILPFNTDKLTVEYISYSSYKKKHIVIGFSYCYEI